MEEDCYKGWTVMYTPVQPGDLRKQCWILTGKASTNLFYATSDRHCEQTGEHVTSFFIVEGAEIAPSFLCDKNGSFLLSTI